MAKDKIKKSLEEELRLVEVPPEDSWFVETQDAHGNALVFLRIQITGLLPRRAGPFPDRDSALRAFDWLLDDLLPALDCEWPDTVRGYCIKRPFAHRFEAVQAEDELGQAYLCQATQKPTHKAPHLRKPSKRKAA